MVYSISFIMCYTVSRDSAWILNLKIYACACALILKSVPEAAEISPVKIWRPGLFIVCVCVFRVRARILYSHDGVRRCCVGN